MGRSKPRFNSKARQIVDNSKTPKPVVKVKVDIVDKQTTSGYGGCDASNPLVLPSKKTKQGHKKFKDKVVPKKLSKKKRKMLEKVLQRKTKKEKRNDILASLAEHQASPEEMALFTSTAHLGQKTTKRDADVQLKRNQILCINSVKGANKRRRLEEVANKKEASSADETDSSESDSDSEQEEENKIEDTKTNDLERTKDKEEKNKQSLQNSVSDCKAAETHRTDIATKEASNRKASSIKQTEYEPAVFVPLKRSQEVQEARLALPILAEEQMIMEAVKENPVVIICGETGSGKTTQVPQFLYEAGFAKKGMIGVTEPRRVAAVNMSQRVGKEMGLGKKKISYQIRYEGTVTSETEIKFMTDGVLLKEIQKDFLLTKYSAIIIDEAHERSVYTDILIGLLSRIVPLRNKKDMPLKLIIMSATLRVEDFTENSSLFKVTPPVIKIDSRQFPVTIHFNKKTPLENYVAEAYRKVLKIHRTLPPGGILVFVTGQGEINTLCRKLKARYELRNFKRKKAAGASADKDDEELEEEKDREFKKTKLPRINLDSYSTQPYEEEEVEEDKGEVQEDECLHDDESDQEDEDDDDKIADALGPSIEDEIPLYVLPMYSLLPPHKQAKVFMPPPQGTRLCVISTNVSETSLTIPGIKYVVDTGRVKKRYYDNVTGVSSFKITWTSKASADQRSGRSGRTEPGHSYRLYSSAVFNSDFEKFDSPEITRKPVDDLILQMKDMGIDKVVNFPFPTPPELEAMKAAERHLTMLGALEQPAKAIRPSDKETFTCKITPLGKAMAAFPVAPCYSKMISLGQQQGCLPYIIALVAALTVREIFEGNVGAGESGEGNEALKVKRAKSSHYKKIWAGKGSAAEFGDLMVLLGAVGATEYSGCTAGFCQAHSLRYKAMVEIRKLRRLLTNAVNAVSPECGVFVDPKMNPPTDLQVKMLREIVLSGLGNHVARLMPDSQEREAKNAYQCVGIEGAVYIHPDSVLFSKLPEFVVYQEIIETSKAYMRGVIAIEPGWLALLLPHLCTFSKPHEQPPPRYDPKMGSIRCHMTATFGRNAWQLPCQELEFPPSPDRFKWFARFLLEGQVFSGLKKYTSCLLSPPSTMIKTWAKLQPRTQTLLNILAIKRVDSKETLTQAWKEDSNYLMAAYREWLPESKHAELANTWPPAS